MKSNATAPRATARRTGARAQRGVTLLELLIGVGVIIVVMVIVLMGMRGLSAQMDRSALLRQAPQIKMNIAGLGNGDPTSLEKLDTLTAVKIGAFPKDMVSGNNKVSHAFGGEIFTTGLQADVPPLSRGRAFTITYTGIPAAQCASIARGLAMIADGVWVDAATAAPAGTPAVTDMLKAPGSAAAIDITTLAGKCTPAQGDTVAVHALMGL